MLTLLHREQPWALLVLGHEFHYIFSQHHQTSGGSLVQQGPVFRHHLPDVRICIGHLSDMFL